MPPSVNWGVGVFEAPAAAAAVCALFVGATARGLVDGMLRRSQMNACVCGCIWVSPVQALVVSGGMCTRARLVSRTARQRLRLRLHLHV